MSIISDFQKKYGLVPDGAIGKQTLLKIKEVLKIKNVNELANFIGQCAHESADFTIVYENLNYSSDGLLKIFPKYFTSSIAAKYSKNPEKIANRVYANRMGNGNETSGDGWKHRGFGPIQLTGKNAQNRFSDYIKDPAVKTNPELIATKYPLESAKYYFDENNLWRYADSIDSNSIEKLSKAINIGNPYSKIVPNGLEDRIKKTKYYYNLIIS
jgi:putative chitinase